MAYTKEQILDLVNEHNVDFLNLQFTDIIGIIKNITIPVSQLNDAHGNETQPVPPPTHYSAQY